MERGDCMAHVVDLIERFEVLADVHEELTDTDVREAISFALSEYFVWGRALDTFPSTFRMFSAEGDRLVGVAVRDFVTNVRLARDFDRYERGHERLQLLQHPRAASRSGMRYDELWGHCEAPHSEGSIPQDMFGKPDYDE